MYIIYCVISVKPESVLIWMWLVVLRMINEGVTLIIWPALYLAVTG